MDEQRPVFNAIARLAAELSQIIRVESVSVVLCSSLCQEWLPRIAVFSGVSPKSHKVPIVFFLFVSNQIKQVRKPGASAIDSNIAIG